MSSVSVNLSETMSAPSRLCRVAVVGAGTRAAMFIQAVCDSPTHRLEVLCDASPQAMERALASMPPDVASGLRTYGDDELERMLQRERPDLVIICSPDVFHADQVVAALEAGCDVLLEKPLAIDAEGCRKIHEAVRASRGKVRVAFNCRFMPWAVMIKRLLAQGVVGRVVQVSVEWMLDARKGAMYATRWHSQKRYSGGLLVHKATHHFDLVNWWLDATPQRVYAWGRRAFFGDEHRGEWNVPELGESYLEGDHSADPLCPGDRVLEGWRRLPADSHLPRPGRSVWRRTDLDMEDTLSVHVEYSRQIHLVYTLNAFLPRMGRHVIINGTRGRLEFHEDESGPMNTPHAPPAPAPPPHARPAPLGPLLIVHPLFGKAYQLPIPQSSGDHDGADPIMLLHLFGEAAHDPSLQQHAGDEQGAASALIGIAGNQSIEERRLVDLRDMAPWMPQTDYLHELR